jgi:hypothetical protein
MIQQLHPVHAVASAAVYIENTLSSGIEKIRAIFSQIFTDAPTRQAEQPVHLEATAQVIVAAIPQSPPSCPAEAFARLTPLQQLGVQSEKAEAASTKAFATAGNNVNAQVIALAKTANAAEVAYQTALSPYGINHPKDHFKGIAEYFKFVKEYEAKQMLHHDHIAMLEAILKGR